VRFVIAGDGDARVAFQRLAADLGIADRVHFLGWRRDVPAILANLTVVVLPTVLDFEGTPLAVIEALAAGRPVVATDVGGVSEVVRDGLTGLLVPPRDPSALASAIGRQLDRPREAHAMAAAGQRLVLSMYARDRMVSETEQYLQELLDARGQPQITQINADRTTQTNADYADTRSGVVGKGPSAR
jgi:glycosyltransferase involved in cell wall biosynthesis